MAEPIFGLTITQVDNEPRPAITADMSTIGLVVTAPGADVTKYPVNTPVFINSADDDAVGLLGTTGTIANQIDLINAQFTGFSASASIVIVRVDEGVDDDATTLNLIDGIDALLDSESMLGVAPRLIAVPGYTWQQAGAGIGNPIVAHLPGVLEKLVAHAVVSGPKTGDGDITDWRQTFASKRLIPMHSWVKVGVALDVVDAAAAVLGMMVARDSENGGRPFKSTANRAMQGIVDTFEPLQFSTTDGNSAGQLMLGRNLSIIVRGQSGSVTSLGDAGFTFVGTDTASDDDLWRFYHVTRGRDYIHLMFLRTLRFYLGRFNLTSQTIESILNTMKIALRDLEATGDILGFQVGFERDKNSPENLRLGRFNLNFKAEEPPVLRHLTIESYRYRPALDALLDNIQALAA